MEDVNGLPPPKKRVATREISKDNPGLDDEDDTPEQEMGTFKRASDDVLASRRIVKVRRQSTFSVSASAPSVNPFAGILLVPPPAAAPAPVAPAEATIEMPDGGEKMTDEEVDQRVEEKNESENITEVNEGDPEKRDDEVAVESAKDESSEKAACSHGRVDSNGAAEKAVETKPTGDGIEKQTEEEEEEAADDGVGETDETKPGVQTESGNEKAGDDNTGNENSVSRTEAVPLSSFKQHSSSQNAFTGLASTGFSSTTFSFGSISKDGSPSGSGFLFCSKTNESSIPSSSFSTSTSGSSSLFRATGADVGDKSEASGMLSMQEVPVETGEENEKTIFCADSVLFEFLDVGWKERGKGEVKVNISTSGLKERARLVMRARGNLRLILNASLYPDMKLANMDERGISFSCVNSTTEGKSGLSTLALKFKDGSVLESFSSAVAAHQGKSAESLKTHEY
ncbi:hypothetical protein Dimus_027773 [Dionaea muscipula]